MIAERISTYGKLLPEGVFASIEEKLPVKFNKSVVSLFSGAGGLDIGLERAGFETLACVEMDENCRRTLQKNRPEWLLIDGDLEPGNIRGVRGADILEKIGLNRGELGLVVGGPPCQSYSNLGLRRGKFDPVNGDLVAEYARIVEELYPEGFIFENVEGFRQAKHADVKEWLVAKLTGLGYKVVFDVLVSADYGDPQIRRRFVMIGSRVNEPKLPFPTHFESEEKRQRLVDEHGISSEEFYPYRTVGQAFAELKKWNLKRSDNVTMGVSDVVENRMKLIGAGQNFHVLPDEMRPNCWRSGRHQGADTFGRLWLDRPSVTIRTSAYNPAKGRYIHPTQNRGLSTMEMSVLQSFPEEWEFVCTGRPTLVGIGRMIGNAVPINLATALGLSARVSIAKD